MVGNNSNLPFGSKGCLTGEVPQYNLMRLLQTVFASLLFTAICWNQGQELNNQQNLFNLLGGACCSVIFFGVSNCILVLPYVSMERSVMYRERFAGMYSPWAYAIAQVITEIPYVFTQTFIFVVITYPMIGYYGSANKIARYFYAMFCTLSYYTYFGMMLIAVTPNLMVAAIVTTAASSMFNLFSGYFVPKPRIPKCWLWFYYLMPTSWTINGMLTSQYGDVQKEVLIFGRPKRVSAFLEDYFGFHHDQLAITGVVLAMFPIAFASLFAIFIGRLNFQKR